MSRNLLPKITNNQTKSSLPSTASSMTDRKLRKDFSQKEYENNATTRQATTTNTPQLMTNTQTTTSATAISSLHPPPPLASEHWKIRKQKQLYDQEMNTFYDQQITQCRIIEEQTNQQSQELFNTIFHELKWSNPSLSTIHSQMILQYCKHLIQFGSTKLFLQENDLKAWNSKCKATKREKLMIKIKKLYLKLYQIIEKRDLELNHLQNELLLKGEQLKLQKDISLKWMMEMNVTTNQRNKFFTIWDLCIRNCLRELKVLLKCELQKRIMDYLLQPTLLENEFVEKSTTSQEYEQYEGGSTASPGRSERREGKRVGRGNTQRTLTSEASVSEKSASQYQEIMESKSELEQIISAIEENGAVLIKEQEDELNQSLSTSAPSSRPNKKGESVAKTSSQVQIESIHQADTFMKYFTLNNPTAIIISNFINQKDPDFGWTPLHYACKYNHYRIAHFLLIVGGNPNLTCPDGRNALHFAAAYGDKELLRLLLSKGGNAFHKDFYQCTPLDLAKQNQNKKTIPTLLNWERITNEMVHKDLTNGGAGSSQLPSSFRKLQILEQTLEQAEGNLLEAEDDNGAKNHQLIPEEYRSTREDLFLQMSPKLKLLVKRLNGCNPYLTEIIHQKEQELFAFDNTRAEIMNSRLFSLNSTSHTNYGMMTNSAEMTGGFNATSSSFATNHIEMNETSAANGRVGIVPASQIDQDDYSLKERTVGTGADVSSTRLDTTKYMLEIRLCTKYFIECVKDDFLEEAIRSLYRRWSVAKHLYDLSIQRFHFLFDEISDMKQEESTTMDGVSMIESSHQGSRVLEQQFSGVLEETDPMKDGNKGEGASIPLEAKVEVKVYEGPVELDKLAVDFYKTATNITFAEETPPNEAEDKMQNGINDGSSNANESSTAASSLLFPNITRISDNIYMEVESRTSLQSSERKTKEQSILHEEEVNNEKKKKKIIQQKNPEYLLKIIHAFIEKEKIERLQDYSWKYDHLLHSSYFPILSSKFSSTISWIEENSMTISTIDFSTYQPFSSYFERFHSTNITSKLQQPFFPSLPSITGAAASAAGAAGTVVGGEEGNSPNNNLAPSVSLLNSVGLFPAGNYYVSLGYDLVEIHVLLKQYLKAILVLEECLYYTESIFISLRILLLLQKCDILLYLYDHYEENKMIIVKELLQYFDFHLSSSTFSSSFGERRWEENDDSYQNHPIVNATTLRERRNISQRKIRNIDRYVNLQREFCFHAKAEQLFPSIDPSSSSQTMMMMNPPPPASLPSEGSFNFSESISMEASSYLDLNSVNDKEGENNSHSPKEAPNNIAVAGTLKILDPPFHPDELSAILQSSNQWLLSSCQESAQEIMSLSYLLSAKYLIEPYSIALSLYYLARVEEKYENYSTAWKYVEEGSTIALRSQAITFEIIEMMLHGQVIFVKHLLSTKEEYQMFCQRSNEINQWIIRLADQYSVSYHKTKNIFEKKNHKKDQGEEEEEEEELPLNGLSSSISKFQNKSIHFPPTFLSSYDDNGNNAKIIQRIEKLWQKSAEILSLGTIFMKDNETKILNIESERVQVKNKATYKAAVAMGLKAPISASSSSSFPSVDTDISLASSSLLIWNDPNNKKRQKQRKQIHYL